MEEIITPSREPSASPKKGRGMGGIIAIILVIAVAVAAWFYFDRNQNGESRSSAAVVNGYTITNEEFKDRVERAKVNYELQGADLSTPEAMAKLEKQTAQDLVNERLILQDAEKKNITVDDATQATALKAIRDRFSSDDEFKKELERGKLNEESWKENVRRELILQKYIEESVKGKDVTVTDAEVKAYYDSLAKGQPEGSPVPKLEEVKQQLSSQLQSQKVAAIMQGVIEELKKVATIEIAENLK